MNLEEKIELYAKLEQEILDELEKLEGAETECDCDDKDVFKYIHEGEWDEIMAVCTNCGGFLEVE